MPHLEDDWVCQAPGHDARLTEQALHEKPDVQRIRLMVAYSNEVQGSTRVAARLIHSWTPNMTSTVGFAADTKVGVAPTKSSGRSAGRPWMPCCTLPNASRVKNTGLTRVRNQPSALQ